MGGQGSRSTWAERYTDVILRWRWPVLIFGLMAFLAVGSGMQHLQTPGDYRIYFDEQNPYLEAFDRLQETFTKNDNVLYVIAPRDGEVFTPETLAAIDDLTQRAWKTPYSTRVDSITNFQHTYAEGDDLIVEDLVSPGMSAEDIANARAVALGDPQLVRRLISPSGHVTGVNVTVQLDSPSPEQILETVAFTRELAETIRTEHPGVDIYLTGVIMLNIAFVEAAMGDMITLTPLMYLVVLVIMGIFLRSVLGTFATLLVVLLSTLAAMGGAGWLRMTLTPQVAVVPTLVMTLAVADCVHILTTFFEDLRAGMERRAAILETLRINLPPVFLTSITTTIGFLSMNSSETPPLREMGNATAIGVMAAFVASVTILPALMAVLPLRIQVRETRSRRAMDHLGNSVVAHRRPLLALGGILLVGLALCIPLNELNDNFVRYFDERVPFRQHTDFATAHLTGMYQVEYEVGSGESGGLSDPEYLARLAEFTDWWREQPEVIHVNSLSDVMKRLNKNMHGDDPDRYHLPENRQLAAQYMLLYEMSLPYGLDLNNQIDIDKSATRVTVTLNEISTGELIEVAARGERWLEDNAPEAMHAYGVGSSILFSHITERNIQSMLRGTVFALILISLILVFALKSLRLGVISLVPNLVPAILGFGVWGLLVGKVGFGLSIVMAMTLGIVVDDTVHFLSKYHRARREHELAPPEAVLHTFGRVGWALLSTTIVLVAGFLVLSTSTFAQNSDMGQLTAIVLTFALIADFLFLPPLLLALEGSTKDP